MREKGRLFNENDIFVAILFHFECTTKFCSGIFGVSLNQKYNRRLNHTYRRSTHHSIPVAANKNNKLGVMAERNGGQLLMTPKLENNPLSI